MDSITARIHHVEREKKSSHQKHVDFTRAAGKKNSQESSIESVTINTTISEELDEEPIVVKSDGRAIEGDMMTLPPLATISMGSVDLANNPDKSSVLMQSLVGTESFAPASVSGSEMLDQVLGKLEHDTEPRNRHTTSSSRNTGTHGCMFRSEEHVTISPGQNIVKLSIATPMRLENTRLPYSTCINIHL